MGGGLLKYWTFSGRASRAEFAAAFAASMGLDVIALALQHGLPPGVFRDGTVILLNALEWWLFLAASVRRLHDMNKSGWLLLLMPIAGFVFLVWWFCLPGRNPNRYGATTPPIAAASAG